MGLTGGFDSCLGLGKLVFSLILLVSRRQVEVVKRRHHDFQVQATPAERTIRSKSRRLVGGDCLGWYAKHRGTCIRLDELFGSVKSQDGGASKGEVTQLQARKRKVERE